MAEIVYALCALASIACATLLWRGYLRNATPLLFWSAACFIAIAASNTLLFVDLALVPTIDLALPRALLSFAAVMMLLRGMISDTVR